MKTINELLDEAAKALGKDGKPISDTKMAAELGAYQQKLYDWRNGKGQPDTYAVWQLSEILDMDPREIMAIIEGERAKTDERRSYWEAAQKRFRETTKMVFLALALSFFFVLPQKTQATVLIENSYHKAAIDQCLLCQVRRRWLLKAMNALGVGCR